MRNAVGVTCGEHGDAHGARGSVDAAIADERTRFYFLDVQYGDFPGERRRDVRARPSERPRRGPENA